jgi:hypothetical protein
MKASVRHATHAFVPPARFSIGAFAGTASRSAPVLGCTPQLHAIPVIVCSQMKNSDRSDMVRTEHARLKGRGLSAPFPCSVGTSQRNGTPGERTGLRCRVF